MADAGAAERRGTVRELFEDLVPLARSQREARIADATVVSPELRPDVHNLLWLHDRAEEVLAALGAEVDPDEDGWERITHIARALHGHPTASDPAPIPARVMASLRHVDLRAEPASPSERPVLNRRIGRYRIVEHIGTGGMGVVYRAVDDKLGKSFALKFLPPYLSADSTARARFEHEARAASALDHPNIASVHEIGEAEDGRLFIGMAYYEGETLAARLERGPLPIDEALDVARQMAAGLRRAHERGIIHRDIKPANVLLTSGGIVKLLDFGVAKIADVTLTTDGQRIGTAAYMSPEQARSEATDHRTDIWSVGVVLYEMLTGERPFHGAYEAAVIYALMNTPHGPLHELRPDVPLDVEAIVDACLEKARADRFGSMVDVYDALTSAIERRKAPAALPVDALRPRPRTRSWMVGGGGAVLLMVVLSIGMWMRGSLPDQRHLAILPFDVIGEAEAGEALSVGLVQTLSSRLSQIEQFERPLWVVPASEIPPGTSASEARGRLGATLVVSGSVQVVGESIRLTLNLIDTRTRRQIDSKQIDHRQTDALALQDEAALILLEMMRVRLEPQARQTIGAGGTRNPEANLLFLRGMGYLRDQQRIADLDRAISLFEAATEIDTSFALAHAGLGEAFWRKYRQTEDVLWAGRAIESSRRALVINPDLAPVHVALGTIQADMGQFEDARASFRRGLAIDPQNAGAFRQLARAYAAEGRDSEAEATYRRAITLRPDNWQGYNSLGIFLYNGARYEEAVEAFRRGLEVAPAHASMLINIGASYFNMMRLEEALAMFERVLELNPDHAGARSNIATLYFYTGRFSDAVRMYEEKLALTPNDHVVQGYLADSYHWNGQQDRAREGYRRAIRLARNHLPLRGHDPDLVGGIAGYFARLGEADSARVYLARVARTTSPAEAQVDVAFGIGEVYEQLTEREEALRWMRPALESGYGWMQINFSPWLRELRQHPEIKSIIENPPPASG